MFLREQHAQEQTLASKNRGLHSLISVTDAARRLGISEAHVRGLFNQGRLTGIRTPIGRLLDRSSVEKLALERAREEPVGPGMPTPARGSDVARRILRTSAAAEYVGLAPSTLEKLRSRPDGPTFIRLGRRAVRYDVRDLDAWLDGRREDDSAQATTPKDPATVGPTVRTLVVPRDRGNQ